MIEVREDEGSSSKFSASIFLKDDRGTQFLSKIGPFRMPKRRLRRLCMNIRMVSTDQLFPTCPDFQNRRGHPDKVGTIPGTVAKIKGRSFLTDPH